MIVLTNSEALSERFNVKFIDGDIELWIEENINKMNVERLQFLKVGLKSSGSENIFILMKDNHTDNDQSYTGNIIGGAVIGYNENGWSFTERFKFALKSLSVAPEHQGKGLSKKLIVEIFHFLKSQNISVLKQSSYTPEGYQRIRENFIKESKKYPDIEFVDYEK